MGQSKRDARRETRQEDRAATPGKGSQDMAAAPRKVHLDQRPSNTISGAPTASPLPPVIIPAFGPVPGAPFDLRGWRSEPKPTRTGLRSQKKQPAVADVERPAPMDVVDSDESMSGSPSPSAPPAGPSPAHRAPVPSARIFPDRSSSAPTSDRSPSAPSPSAPSFSSAHPAASTAGPGARARDAPVLPPAPERQRWTDMPTAPAGTRRPELYGPTVSFKRPSGVPSRTPQKTSTTADGKLRASTEQSVRFGIF